MLLRGFIAALMAGLFSVSDASALDPLDEANKAFEAARASLASNEFQQAELYLERTLMYQPEHAEARVELALLLASRGRVEAALLFIESLVLDPRTPAPYRDRLMALSRSLQSTTPAPVAWRGQTEVALGYQHNPLAGTSASSLLLTLPGGVLELPVEDQVDSAPVLRASTQATHVSGLYLEAHAHSILGGVKRSAGRLLLSNNIKDVSQGIVSLGFTTEKTPFGDQNRALFAAWTGAETRLSTQFYDSTDQEKRSLTARWDTSIWAHRKGGIEATLAGFMEHEWAIKQGPDQTRVGMRVITKINEKSTIWSTISAHRDVTGYSEFLEEKARRELLTAHVQAEHLLARTSERASVLIQIHLTRRWANLPLFNYQDAGAFLVFRQAW